MPVEATTHSEPEDVTPSARLHEGKATLPMLKSKPTTSYLVA